MLTEHIAYSYDETRIVGVYYTYSANGHTIGVASFIRCRIGIDIFFN
jgi:hypothetical protein